jgi:DNA-damage-inducible protein J
MTTDTVVRARIDGQVKEEASHVLEDMGLSISDAIRILLVRVAAEKAMPFEIRVPNAETVKAMKAARKGKVSKAKSVEEFMAALNADD